MCGIAGIIDFSKSSPEGLLQMMTDQLTHRGPDDFGYFESAYLGAYIGLGHRRLSILDLSPRGHQPMTFDGCTIIFNGEIYNYQEIRSELEGEGHSFGSDSDTEVALKAIYSWGPLAVKKFNGMFAIAFYNLRAETVTLFRDRAGIKPLFIFEHTDLILFSSEMSSFRHHPRFEKKLDYNSLRQYFKYGYIPSDASIFKGASKLEPGCYITISLKSKSILKDRYWEISNSYHNKKSQISRLDAISETERLLQKACNYRMMADVPVGVFLSGGYDSTAVSTLIQKEQSTPLKTFTVGFEDSRYNEAPHAAAIAKHIGTDHADIVCTSLDAVRILDKIGVVWDEPFGDPSAIPTLLVSELAKKSVKVSLSADGGDELFAGYRKYYQILKLLKLSQTLNGLPFGEGLIRSISSSARLISGISSSDLKRKIDLTLELIKLNSAVPMLDRIQHIFSDNQLNNLLPHYFTDASKSPFVSLLSSVNGMTNIDSMLAIDYQTYQRYDILTKIDRATMSVGLEGREPLLDVNLYEYVSSLPDNVKYFQQEPKYILKEIVHKYVPRDLMDRPKQGFSIPLAEWLRTVFRSHVMHYLSDERIGANGFLSIKYVGSLLDKFLKGDETASRQIWLILIFQLWCENWQIES